LLAACSQTQTIPAEGTTAAAAPVDENGAGQEAAGEKLWEGAQLCNFKLCSNSKKISKEEGEGISRAAFNFAIVILHAIN